jgi:tRNA threonylcarbamoyladenosine biosynthesis protein TsaB
MNILVFDTSNETLVAGLALDDGRKASRAFPGTRHSEILFPAIEECFASCGASASDIDLIACTLGPGSFTGLRIGLAAAKGLSLALGKPWVGIPTLDAFAWAYRHESRIVVPVLDARKKRLYAGIYKEGILRGEYLDIAESELLARLQGLGKILFTGPGTRILGPSILDEPLFSIEESVSEDLVAALAALGRETFEKKGPASEDEGPLYLREPEIG